MEYVLILSVTFVAFALNILNRYKISKFLKIIDYPDKKRKIHKSPIPLNGALWFPIYLILILIYFFLYENEFESIIFYISIISLILFLVGMLDDSISLNPNYRLLIFFLIFVLFFETNNEFRIKEIYFESLDFNISLNIFSSVFTAFCLTAFINSINLVDGINGLANAIILIILSTLYLNFEINNFFILIIIIYLILNNYFIYKNYYFLGDAGSLGLSTFVGLYVIYIYNVNFDSNLNLLKSEDIFILMSFPGLDMLRVFISRILRKKSPFIGEKNHLHHFLIKKYSLKITLTLYLSFMLIPIISNFFVNIYASYNLLLCFILYQILLKISVHKTRII